MKEIISASFKYALPWAETDTSPNIYVSLSAVIDMDIAYLRNISGHFLTELNYKRQIKVYLERRSP